MTNRVRGGERQERRHDAPPSRTFWLSWDLSVKDEPLLWALIKYRQAKNRIRVIDGDKVEFQFLGDAHARANLVSSITTDGRQMPILDLDYSHAYYESQHPGRGYLALPGDMSDKVGRAFVKAGISTQPYRYGNARIDVPHHYEKSTHPGHGHLYIDYPISKWKWFWLMVRLRRAGIIELGYFVWSLRRGGNFVRTVGTEKKPGDESGRYTYGWLFKLRGEK